MGEDVVFADMDILSKPIHHRDGERWAYPCPLCHKDESRIGGQSIVCGACGFSIRATTWERAKLRWTISKKRCPVCEHTKDKADFYRKHTECKSCSGRIAKERYPSLKDKRREYLKGWRSKNREAVNKKQNEYRKRKKRKYREYALNGRIKRKKAIQRYNKEYYWRNPEKQRQRAKEYKSKKILEDYLKSKHTQEEQ